MTRAGYTPNQTPDDQALNPEQRANLADARRACIRDARAYATALLAADPTNSPMSNTGAGRLEYLQRTLAGRLMAGDPIAITCILAAANVDGDGWPQEQTAADYWTAAARALAAGGGL